MVNALASEGEVGYEATTNGLWFVEHAWVVVLLPLISAALILFFGKRTPGKGAVYGIVAVGAAFVFSLGVLWHFVEGGGPFEASIDWFTIGPLHLELGILVDGLTAVMLVVVTSVSLCVHIYSLGYMHGDDRFTWFYVVLSLFTAAMLMVVVSNNLIQLLVGLGDHGRVLVPADRALVRGQGELQRRDQGVHHDPDRRRPVHVRHLRADRRHRVHDHEHHRDLRRARPRRGLAAVHLGGGDPAVRRHDRQVRAVPAARVAARRDGRSHAGLGPDPRRDDGGGRRLPDRPALRGLRGGRPVGAHDRRIVAAITMLGAALLAIVQDDIKRVLAYSTLSQLAYMVAGLSLGERGLTAGFFHLFTHAFFKALLFLGAGSVIHAVHSNNMSDMGGLRKPMPVTFWTMLIGSLALAGIFPLAGFWSKDELLVVAEEEHVDWLFVVFLITAVITAFYTMRMVLLTFFGEYKGHAHPHESPATMTGPLVVLAAATSASACWGRRSSAPCSASGSSSRRPTRRCSCRGSRCCRRPGPCSESSRGTPSTRSGRPGPTAGALGPLWNVFQNRYYIDAFYMRAIVYPVRDTWSAGVNWFNQDVLDGIVNGAATLARGLGQVVAWFDRTVIDGVVNGAGETAGRTGGVLKYLQTGNVQWYAVGLFVGVIVLAVVFIELV